MRRFLGRVLTLAVLSWLAIEIHEGGHYLYYRLAGYHARISLQQTTPLVQVPMGIEHAALLAGPAVSALAAIAFLLVALRRPGFGWAAASFTNASLRLFPLTMDLIRAIQDGRPFSDEGMVFQMTAGSQSERVGLVLLAIALFLTLTVLAAKTFRFRRWAFVKTLGIYLFTLAIGIGVVILDELTHNKIIQVQSRESTTRSQGSNA
jgi:hypothetical protein